MHKVVLDGVEALSALAERGTVTEAAQHLGLSQSAVSKRLQALERAVGRPVLEPDGRRVALTTEGLELLARARPLLAGLRELSTPLGARGVRWSLVLDDELATAWGPAVLAAALEDLGHVQLDPSSARGALPAEQVRSGQVHLALAASKTEADADLIVEPIVDEPWVLVHAAFERRPGRGPLLVPVELATAALAVADPALATRPATPVASGAAALHLARSGFGDAVVPMGLVLDADLPRKAYRPLTATRPTVLIARRSLGAFAAFGALRDAVRDRAERRLLGKRSGKRSGREG
jgi:DNA-binding transcriptional LysR family regulator